jgi:hypothetical protein
MLSYEQFHWRTPVNMLLWTVSLEDTCKYALLWTVSLEDTCKYALLWTVSLFIQVQIICKLLIKWRKWNFPL